MHVNNVAPSIAISGAASVNEGSSYSLTLGAVTDPGTDTVTSWIVHWGDGNSDTYGTDGVKTHTYADGPDDYAITVDLIDEDGTFLDRANALSVHVNNVAPSIAISGDASVNEGSSYSLTLGTITDPGTDTVSSYVVHWGDGSDSTYSHERRQDPYLRRRSRLARHHRRPHRRGRHLPRPRQRTLGRRRQPGALDPDQRGRQRQRRLLYSLTLGAVTDPGADTVTSWIVHWGDGDNAHVQRPTAARPTRTRTGPTTTTITVDLVDEDGTFLDRANALNVTVDNVAPTATFTTTTAPRQ